MICGEWEPSGECRAISERHFFLKVCVSDGQLVGPPRSANETTGRPRGQGVAFPWLLSSKECVADIQVGQHRPPNRWKGSWRGWFFDWADGPFTWPQRPFWWPPGLPADWKGNRPKLIGSDERESTKGKASPLALSNCLGVSPNHQLRPTQFVERRKVLLTHPTVWRFRKYCQQGQSD